jgi:hypothetical protein
VRAKKFKLTPRKPFIPTEYEEQVAVFDFLKWCKLPGADMAYATLNGVRLPIGLAVKMSKAGLKQGPLDINIDVATGGYFGFRGELKRSKGGRLSVHQLLWIKRLNEENYFAVMCAGAKEMIAAITKYLKQPKTVAIPFATEED